MFADSRCFLLCALVALQACSDDSTSSNDSTGTPMDDGASLMLSNYLTVFGDVVRVLNAEPVDNALSTRPAMFEFDGPPSGITLVTSTDDIADVSLPDVPLPNSDSSDESVFQLREYACDAGGTVTVYFDQSFLQSPIVDAYSVYENCAFGGYVFNGITRDRDFNLRPRYESVGSDGVSVVTASGDSVQFSGTSHLANKDVVTRSQTVETVISSLVESRADQDYRVTQASSVLDVQFSPSFGGDIMNVVLADGTTAEFEEQQLDVSLEAAFSLSAPWTSGEEVNVTSTLQSSDSFWLPTDSSISISEQNTTNLMTTDGEPLSLDLVADPAFYWKSGALTISASDDTSLVLEPTDGSSQGINGPAFLVTAADGSTVISQSDIRIFCDGRVTRGCVLSHSD